VYCTKNAVILLVASKVVGPGVNANKTLKCMFLSCQRIAGHCHNTKIAYISFRYLWKFRYVSLAPTSQNIMPKAQADQIQVMLSFGPQPFNFLYAI
jgi:hypothetical protein